MSPSTRDWDAKTYDRVSDVQATWASEVLARLELKGDTIGSEERLLRTLNERIRDVRMGPDGALWLATDSSSGRILRLAPVK